MLIIVLDQSLLSPKPRTIMSMEGFNDNAIFCLENSENLSRINNKMNSFCEVINKKNNIKKAPKCLNYIFLSSLIRLATAPSCPLYFASTLTL